MSVGIRNAARRFGSLAAVDGVDLDVAEGEFVAVVGASGCGKSTLLRLVAGLEMLDGGSISIGGRLVSEAGRHVSPERRGVGVVFQSYALWPHMNVRDNVAFPCEAAGVGRRRARSAAVEHLETVGLTDHADRRPAQLSGGQRQRVALARCLAQGAHTILMDEPLANLDPHLRASMEEELSTFQRRTKATVLYITHDQREAFAVADRVAVMAAGRILQCEAPEVIYSRPVSVEVARFIGRSAILGASRDGDEADLGPIRIAVTGPRDGRDIRVLIRPEDVVVADGAPIPGRVRVALYRGGAWEALVSVDGLDDPLPVTVRHRLMAGDDVRLSVAKGWVLPSHAPGNDARRQDAS